MELLIESGILETEHFNRAVSLLESEGEIIIIKRKKIALPYQAGYLRAVIVRHNKSFLFAEPESKEIDDIYIHAADSKGAMPGDTVMLKNISMTVRGPSAAVDKILVKGSRIITGVVEREKGRAGKAYVMPDNNFAYRVRIVKGGELKSKNGDKVKAAISYDQKERLIKARVIHIYGRADSAKIRSTHS